MKIQVTKDVFTRIGKLENSEIHFDTWISSPSSHHYRNKMEFSFSNKRWLMTDEIKEDAIIEHRGLGFHKPGMWDKVVDINKCHLQAKPSNEIRNAIRSYALEKKLEV